MLAMWKWDITDVNCEFKRKRDGPTGKCLNSPDGLERHSPPKQPTMDSTTDKGAERLVDQEKLSIDPWTRVVGKANEERIVINGYPVTALLDTGSQITHVSKAFCQAKGIQISPSNHLVESEGTGGIV